MITCRPSVVALTLTFILGLDDLVLSVVVVFRDDGVALANDEVLLVPRVCVVQASGRVRLVEDARVGI